ncbi:MAG: SDR family oxidoreductase [Cyanobacteria bacterium P01_F01_bin.42]
MAKVLVTGATGRTGSIVLTKLRDRSRSADANFEKVCGFARSAEKAEQVFGSVDNLYFGDINDPDSLNSAIAGMDALVILTSAVPKMTPAAEPGKPPECSFEERGTPEEVDYQGQLNQINCAKDAGVKHIVLVGSMGGTDEQHPLNQFGKILIWKRKAEQYLIDSGVDYTIIRAGGLINEPGGREVLIGKDDRLLNSPPGDIPTTIPRDDVAEVVVQALLQPNARNKAFDTITKPASEQSISQDFNRLFAQAKSGL